jgi:raffinose/stachyose/melibiose transport system permease protein
MTVKKTNWPVMILLILGLSTIIFPLYMTIVIAFKQPSEMTNSIKGILSLPKSWSFSNFKEAMEVTDFWRSLGNKWYVCTICNPHDATCKADS